MDQRPIGIFDSGVGGLTVLSAVRELLAEESTLYLGDTARVPYGNRGADTVRKYARNATRLLREHDIKALVIACNTASAYAYESLAAGSDIPVIGVIDPVVKAAVRASKTGSIGVIGTRGTIRSAAYPEAIARQNAQIEVVQVACPLFVPLAEEGWSDGPVVDAVCREYLSQFAESSIDTLILGCTHYPLLRDTIASQIEQICGREIAVLDCARATADVVHQTLTQHDLLASGATNHRFWATDDPARFLESARSFMTMDVEHVEHVEITDV